MPAHLAPSRSGVHRLACLSLYHALLAQSSRAFAAHDRKADLNQIHEFIKLRFRKDQKLYSITRIANALKAGHEALELFSSCAQGNKESIQRVDSLLTVTRARWQEVHEQRRAQAQARAAQRPARPTPTPTSSPTTTSATKRRILQRPYASINGRRRVPVLVSARGLPFLRTQKPQPQHLSDTLRGLLNHRWRRMKRRMVLERELQMAEYEDAWDQRTGQDSKGEEEPSWASVVRESLDDVNYKIIKRDHENRVLAQQMWDVVLRERELVKKEAAERKKLREEKEET